LLIVLLFIYSFIHSLIPFIPLSPSNKESLYFQEAVVGDFRGKVTPVLPFINQKDILKTLETHVNTLPVQHVLLIWGAKSVGKTGALLTKAAEWEKMGHLVTEVDLKGLDGAFDSFITMFEEQ
jgi:hypothetical protein